MPRRRRNRTTSALVLPGDVEQKAAPDSSSFQPRFHARTAQAYGFIMALARREDDIPAYGNPERDNYLSTIWHQEPILGGAVTAMCQKVSGLSWVLNGGRNLVKRYSKLLADVQQGVGWTQFVQMLAQAYFTKDNGAFVELGRESKNGPVSDLFLIDPGRVRVTGNIDFPYEYTPRVGGGKTYRIPEGDAVRMASMPSVDEAKFGLGFCAVSRAVRAARLLTALHEYDWEKLSDMPPQGIAAITGMNETQVQEAVAHYDESRKNRGRYIFPGLLWLAAANMGGPEVAVNLTAFSQLPDQFDRQTVINFYVYTLALAFGVDAREFWPATATGATKADALVQATKAKGKGPAEIIQTIERFINFHVLPDGVDFEFDFQDDEEDERRAGINAVQVDTVVKLFAAVPGSKGGAGGGGLFGKALPADVGANIVPGASPTPPATPPSPPTPPGEEGGIISRDEARQLLAEWGVLPEKMVMTEESVEDDTSSHKDLPAKARFKDRKLRLLSQDTFSPPPAVDWDELLRESQASYATIGDDWDDDDED